MESQKIIFHKDKGVAVVRSDTLWLCQKLGSFLYFLDPKEPGFLFEHFKIPNMFCVRMSMFVHKYRCLQSTTSKIKTRLVCTPWLHLFWWSSLFTWDMIGSSEMFCKAGWMNIWFFIFVRRCFIKVWKANEIRFQKRFIHFLPSYKNFHVRPLHVKKPVSLWISDFEWLPLCKGLGDCKT